MPIGSVFAPEVNVVGSVKVRFTLALFWWVRLNWPLVAAATAIDFATPGKKFPSCSARTPVTVIAVYTVAVAVMFADCAWPAVAARPSRVARMAEVRMVERIVVPLVEWSWIQPESGNPATPSATTVPSVKKTISAQANSLNFMGLLMY